MILIFELIFLNKKNKIIKYFIIVQTSSVVELLIKQIIKNINNKILKKLPFQHNKHHKLNSRCNHT